MTIYLHNILYTFKTAPKLVNTLSSTKAIALGNGPGATVPCGSNKCDSCSLVSNTDHLTVNGRKVVPQKGNCLSRNILYLAICQICFKGYGGKTVQPLRSRINGHRGLFYKVLAGNVDEKSINDPNFNNDLSLSYHLFKSHNVDQRAGFNNFFKFTIFQHCSPGALDAAEHRMIHKLHLLEPQGINSVNPFRIPFVQ